MYGKAQAVFNAALAARTGDPARCRSLLAETKEAADSAKKASLLAYEQDVNTRFEESRAKLVEIGADRAFPDDFARLVSGIDATASLFAARSYLDARFSAYRTLKGMSDLYETVRGLRNWLKDAQFRMESAINTAQMLEASRQAPAEMKDAEQKYHDALTLMQAGDLKAAVESMKAAGQIALRLRVVQDMLDKRTAGVPPAGKPPVQEHDSETQGSNPGVQPPSGDNSLLDHPVRIANMSMTALGAPQKLYSIFSAAVARFDIVAAEGLRDAGIMEKVLSGMSEGWEAAVSRTGYFGFIYSNRIQMFKDLGSYPGKGEFLRTPYAAQFRLPGTRFAVNLVLCHVETSKDRRLKSAEMARLADVYRYYENLTGNRGITLLLSGGLGDVPEKVSESLIPEGKMVSLRTEGLRDQGQRVFSGTALRPLIEETGFRSSTPPAAYVILRTGK
jgi:hypothetical protein